MTFAAVICCSVTLYAQQLTEQEAMERAMQYMNRGKSFAQSRNMAAPANGGGMKLDAAPVETEKIYAFNMEGGGYVIASADSRTLPVPGARPWSRLSRPIGVNDCCIKDYIFTIDDNTGIDNKQEGFPADKSVKTWFDLQGRRLDSLPQGNEIFIMEGKKTVVRINE